MEYDFPKSRESWDRSAELIDELPAAFPEEQFLAYCELIGDWNDALSLVSRGVAVADLDDHLADSISLLPYLEASELHVDIGSGGGFPAIPIAIAMPRLELAFFERNQKKSTFLLRASKALALNNCNVLCESFPSGTETLRATTITARAVEKPEKVRRAIADFMSPGCRFLCQGDRSLDVFDNEGFHVERVSDEFDVAGLRRGPLFLITRNRSCG